MWHSTAIQYQEPRTALSIVRRLTLWRSSRNRYATTTDHTAVVLYGIISGYIILSEVESHRMKNQNLRAFPKLYVHHPHPPTLLAHPAPLLIPHTELSSLLQPARSLRQLLQGQSDCRPVRYTVSSTVVVYRRPCVVCSCSVELCWNRSKLPVVPCPPPKVYSSRRSIWHIHCKMAVQATDKKVHRPSTHGFAVAYVASMMCLHHRVIS